MNIAMRVSMWILGVLVVVSAAVAVLTLTQKQTLQGQNQSLHNQITYDESKLADLTTQVKKLEDDAGQLNNRISQAQQEKTQLQNLYDDLKHKSDALQSQLDQTNSDRDDWKNRASTVSLERDNLKNRVSAVSLERDNLKNRVSAVSHERDDLKNRISTISLERDNLKKRISTVSHERDDLKNRISTISRERDGLIQKLKNPPVKIVYKEKPASAASAPEVDVTSRQGDEYWASVLKQKAALQIEIQKEKSDLNQAALQVVELKKQNSDLGVALKQISNEKDEIIQKIKYGQDLEDNLSIDLARSHNDQQAVNNRANKLKKENLELLSQIRGLSSIKLGLEKTISRLIDEKDAMQKKLIETGSVIQSRIDDIWKIKEGLDKKLSENVPSSSASGSMELPPIIVNAPNNQQQAPPQAPVSGSKNQGSIISINDANSFVIVDLGQENSSVNIGTILKVYRNSKEIATLEVIQIRRDICAGDIKDKSSQPKVGDIVRFN
jgi:chromosome segregation ATPase